VDVSEFLKYAPPLCAGLIDQGRVIGGDPVGHACCQIATRQFWVEGLYWPVCASCLTSLKAGEARVTLPAWKARPGSE
jgi:hypothetical protein